MREKLFNALPLFFLICGLLLTFSFYRKELQSHEENQRTYFRDQITSLRETISYRLQTYTDEQIAGAAFITASNEVTRTEWRRFVTALKLDINYPGINGLGLAVPVQKKDSLAFVQQIQKENMPWFGITSLHKTPEASDYFVIKYIEPQYRNRLALGLDMGSEASRRQAMERARDTGQPIITGKITLVQDLDKTPGFLVYVPVYKFASPKDTVKQQFIGWSFAPFIARNFMSRILPFNPNAEKKPFEFEVYDGPGTDAKSLLFKTWNRQPDEAGNPYQLTFPVYGSQWTIRLLPPSQFEWTKELRLAYLILFGGILLSVMLFFLLRNLANTRRHAIALAEKMTEELRTLNQNLDRKVEERTQELAAKNKQLSEYSENLKNAYEDLEVKVKFRNLQLEKQVKALQDENTKLKTRKEQ